LLGISPGEPSRPYDRRQVVAREIMITIVRRDRTIHEWTLCREPERTILGER
jgi:hypothetical protein